MTCNAVHPQAGVLAAAGVAIAACSLNQHAEGPHYFEVSANQPPRVVELWQPKVGDYVRVQAGFKRCTKCGVVKPENAFHRNRASTRPDCKDCANNRVRQYHRANRNAVIVRQRQRYQRADSEQRREAGRRRFAANPEIKRRSNRRWMQANPERVAISNRASYLVRRAIENGQLVRPSGCQQCGASGVRIEAAHADYSLPLDVRWLCKPCHATWDAAEPKTAEVRRAS